MSVHDPDPALAIQRTALALLLVAATIPFVPTRPPAPTPTALPQICAATDRGVMRGGACAADTQLTPRARRALGRRPCWRTASAQRLTDVAGVGARTAAVLVAYRNAGGRPEVEALSALPGIGEATAAAIAAGVDPRCEALPPTE